MHKYVLFFFSNLEMPKKGPCTDTACGSKIKELYRCHCCSSFICLTHLIEHVEVAKQDKQQIINLRNELKTAVATMKEIIGEQLLMIKLEEGLIEQAKTLLDTPTSSIDKLQDIFEKIDQYNNLSRNNKIK